MLEINPYESPRTGDEASATAVPTGDPMPGVGIVLGVIVIFQQCLGGVCIALLGLGNWILQRPPRQGSEQLPGPLISALILGISLATSYAAYHSVIRRNATWIAIVAWSLMSCSAIALAIGLYLTYQAWSRQELSADYILAVIPAGSFGVGYLMIQWRCKLVEARLRAQQ